MCHLYPPIENKSRYILQGVKTPSGCSYNISLHKDVTEGNITKVARELAVDPTTCQQLVEQGMRSKPESYKTNGTISKSEIVYANKTNKTRTTMLDSTSQATYTTTWYDPVGLEVNHVADTVNWNWNGYTTYFNWGAIHGNGCG